MKMLDLLSAHPKKDTLHDAPHAHHVPTFRAARRFEGWIDLAVIALVVILGAAMIYGLVAGTGTPAYIH